MGTFPCLGRPLIIYCPYPKEKAGVESRCGVRWPNPEGVPTPLWISHAAPAILGRLVSPIQSAVVARRLARPAHSKYPPARNSHGRDPAAILMSFPRERTASPAPFSPVGRRPRRRHRCLHPPGPRAASRRCLRWGGGGARRRMARRPPSPAEHRSGLRAPRRGAW